MALSVSIKADPVQVMDLSAYSSIVSWHVETDPPVTTVLLIALLDSLLDYLGCASNVIG